MTTVICVDCGAKRGSKQAEQPCPTWPSGAHRYSEHEQRGEPRIENTAEVTGPMAE